MLGVIRCCFSAKKGVGSSIVEVIVPIEDLRVHPVWLPLSRLTQRLQEGAIGKIIIDDQVGHNRGRGHGNLHQGVFPQPAVVFD